MNFNDTPEEAIFRQEVRDFLDKELPERFKGTMDRMAGGGGGDMRSRFEEMKEWRKKLADKGWIAAAWPKEYGGAGLGTMEQFIMNEEFAESRAPQVGGMGVSMIGPTLIIHGDDTLLRYELADRAIESEVELMLNHKVIGVQARGMVPSNEATVAKLYSSELDQRIAATGLKLMGLYAQLGSDSKYAERAMDGRFMSTYLYATTSTIGGGTSEVQRNIIAQRGLGLPRD